MTRTTTVAVAIAAVAGLAVGAQPALAKHKTPITETYTATAPTPEPGNLAPGGKLCDGLTPAGTGQHRHDFAVPEAGTLEVVLNGYVGDWDLAARNAKGANIGESGSGGYHPVSTADEKTKIKMKKAEKVTIVACNWAGSPTATVTYTFTYAK